MVLFLFYATVRFANYFIKIENKNIILAKYDICLQL